PRKVDIWAIGVIFAMLLSGIPLFSLTDDEDVVIKDILNPDYVIDRISKSDEYTHISDDAYDMLCHLLAYNPDDRYDASEALNHPLITQSYQRDANNIKLNNNIHEVFDFNIINRMRHSITLPPLARICRLLIAHQCRDREIRRLRDTFRRLDIDGDGYLDKQEIIS
ncbi:calcium-dependent protein kinase, putative, partial [Perkinsus marinus ATCC 50983]